MILGLLVAGSLVWYFTTTNRSTDLQLIGTVDANEVVVSSRIPGRLATLKVTEGDAVKAGQLIATIESSDLDAALAAAEAAASGGKWRLSAAQATERENRGETESGVAAAEAQVKSAQATLAQAQAQLARQKADTSRTVALAAQGIASQQARDEAVAGQQAAEAAVNTTMANVAQSEAALRQARAHVLLVEVAAHSASESRDAAANSRSAVARPTMPGTFSVPGRKPRSW